MRHFILFVSVRLWLVLQAVRTTAFTLIALFFSTFAVPAHAGDDLFGMLDNVAENAEKSGKSLLKMAKFGGTGLVVSGVILWAAKKKNPQISWTLVLTLLGTGFILIAIDQFIKKGQRTIQLNPVDVG